MTFLFGYSGNNIERVAEVIASTLNVQPELRESSFRGGEYWLYSDGEERATLQRNHDGSPTNEPAEDAFSEWPVLLYVEADKEGGIIAKLMQSTIQPTFLCMRKF